LLDQLGPGQFAAVVHLLETMVAPEEDGDALRNAERMVVAEAGVRGIEPPLIRLRAQDHRVFLRDKCESLEISRVLDRKEAYR
jgi:hypothetical protein